MVKFISCFRCNDNGKTSNACHCDEEPQVLSRCEPAYDKLKGDLRKLVEEARRMKDACSWGAVARVHGQYADEIEKLIEGE